MKHKKLIAKCFREKANKINPDHKLDKLMWDSLTKITLIAEFNKKFKKNLNFNKFEKLKTFIELNDLIEQTLKSKK
ncbi:phosphopantetheine-binding protein [Candidatus Pelagibacter sp.]|nr:phosphopantetheine-binding protein [Candidatus Pelagibacter sp.]